MKLRLGMPTPIDQLLQESIAHHQAGQLTLASKGYQQILQQQPDHADALHLLGLLNSATGDRATALQYLQRAVELDPMLPAYRNSLGISLLTSGKVGPAVAEFRQAVKLSPTFVEALSNLGSALLKAGRPDEALDTFSNAIHIRPDLTEPRLGVAAALRDLGRWTESATAYQQVLIFQPRLTQAHIELGDLLFHLGQPDAGVASYQRAIACSPEQIDGYNSLGNALLRLQRFAEAEQAFLSAPSGGPHAGAMKNNLGNLYRVQGRLDEALQAYRAAIVANPQLGAAYSNLGNVLKDRGQIGDAIVALRKAVELDPSPAVGSNLAYTVCFDPQANAKSILAEARGWADRHESPLLSTHQPHRSRRDTDRKLRIGYVSGDFRDHVIGRNVLPVLEHHDRSAFEIHCFSTLAMRDERTPDFVHAADRWHECAMLSDAQLADKVREQPIDILVDLSLHLSGNRLLTFARKPAPVQVTWAGYPGTTGLRSIEYRITDPYLDPPGTDAFYSEKSIRLPHSFWCYRPMPGTPPANPLPAIANGFVTFGCMNNSAKVTEAAMELWSRVLQAVPGSHLLMLAFEGSLRRDIVDYFTGRGITVDRLQFVPPTSPGEHMCRYHLIDISLDPLPYTGHTSSLDSLWMGVPVVTLSGQTCVARGSVTALSNVGLADLIATTESEYVSKSATLAADFSRLVELRQSLRQRMSTSPLCDEVQFTHDLESAYLRAWQDV